MKTYILESFFRFYLWLSGFGYAESSRNVVCDHLGVIDTLGDRRENTRFTWYYSDEFTSIFAVKLPFGCDLQYMDSCGTKSLSFCHNGKRLLEY